MFIFSDGYYILFTNIKCVACWPLGRLQLCGILTMVDAGVRTSVVLVHEL